MWDFKVGYEKSSVRCKTQDFFALITLNKIQISS